jgi:cell division cycle 14
MVTVEVFEGFHLVASSDEFNDPAYHCFSVGEMFSYVGFCDDFGPMNLGTVYRFCKVVDCEIEMSNDKETALVTNLQPRDLTNAVFLVGCYMIMVMQARPDSVEEAFRPMKGELVSYRDVSPGPQNFDLNLIDCWRGLWRAKNLSWLSFDPDSENFDIDEYEHFDSPLNADLHEIVPGKFVAMRGPRSLDVDSPWQDMYTSGGAFSHRDFSPAHYADILEQFDVRTVIRLNAPQYEADELGAAGIAVAELFFEDCTPPPVEIVAKFLLLAEHLPGAIAVHCKAGLGRTGTLIALYMMKHFGFSAREAMGWLRIVRPGSVIGQQQQFLCDREFTMRREADRFRRDGPGGGPAIAAAAAQAAAAEALSREGLAAVKGLVSQVEAEVERRTQRAAQMLSRSASAVPCGPAMPGAEELAAHVAAAAERRSGQRVAAAAAAAAAAGDWRAETGWRECFCSGSAPQLGPCPEGALPAGP